MLNMPDVSSLKASSTLRTAVGNRLTPRTMSMSSVTQYSRSVRQCVGGVVCRDYHVISAPEAEHRHRLVPEAVYTSSPSAPSSQGTG